MTARIYSKNKKTGRISVYAQESRWVPELKQPRVKRTYLGHLNKEGEFIPTTGRRGRPRKDGALKFQADVETVHSLLSKNKQLKLEKQDLLSRLERLETLARQKGISLEE